MNSMARFSRGSLNHRLLTARFWSLGRFSSTLASTSKAPQRTTFRNGLLLSAIGGTGVAGTAATLWIARIKKDPSEDPNDIKALSNISFGRLVTGWIAFAFCSSPTWVDMSESLYNTVSKIPIISAISNVFIMKTFFAQFLGGTTTEECIPRVRELHQRQMGTLLGYNIEAELDGSRKDPDLIAKQIQHVLESITVQGQLANQLVPGLALGKDKRLWVRIKITGLIADPVALDRGSRAIIKARAEKGYDQDVPFPGLPHDGDWEAAIAGEAVTKSDRQQLLQLRATLDKIASKARENNVRIVIDAEQSWYQPVLDSLTDELLQKYNSLDGPPTCIASFQAYLRRYPQLLEQQILRAEEKGYRLLFKQVRGAYIATEAERWKREGGEGPGPVWQSKAETDASFNHGIERTLSLVAAQIRETGSARLSAVFATHNAISIDRGLELLEKHGLASRASDGRMLLLSSEAADCICFAQLYGMKDDLSNKITGSAMAENGLPLVIKSMSYGDLKECLPFLARRATENKAVLEGRGGAASVTFAHQAVMVVASASVSQGNNRGGRIVLIEICCAAGSSPTAAITWE